MVVSGNLISLRILVTGRHFTQFLLRIIGITFQKVAQICLDLSLLFQEFDCGRNLKDFQVCFSTFFQKDKVNSSLNISVFDYCNC